MYRQRRGNVPVYNEARLNERPLPNINQPNDNAPEQNNDGVENDDQNGDGSVVAQGEQTCDEIDLLRPEVILTVGETGNSTENKPNEAEPEIEIGAHNENVGVDPLLVVKDEVFEPINVENIEDDLIDLFAETMILNEHLDYFGSDDECEIAAPMRFDAKINDPISGNKCFTVVVSIFSKIK